jgi:hypothetical protein
MSRGYMAHVADYYGATPTAQPTTTAASAAELSPTMTPTDSPTTAPDVFPRGVPASDVDYSLISSREPADGVSLYISHGILRAQVTDAGGYMTAQITLYDNGEWTTAGHSPTMAQRRVLHSLAVALAGVTVRTGGTAHNVILEGLAARRVGTVKMIIRRLGMDQNYVARRDDIDAVTLPGCDVQWSGARYRHSASNTGASGTADYPARVESGACPTRNGTYACQRGVGHAGNHAGNGDNRPGRISATWADGYSAVTPVRGAGVIPAGHAASVSL